MSLVIAVAVWAIIKSQVERPSTRFIPGSTPGGGSASFPSTGDPDASAATEARPALVIREPSWHVAGAFIAQVRTFEPA